MVIYLESGYKLDTENIEKAIWNPNSAGDGFFTESHVLKVYLEEDEMIVLKGVEAETIYDDYLKGNEEIEIKRKNTRASHHIPAFP